jgi:hypothetical protein
VPFTNQSSHNTICLVLPGNEEIIDESVFCIQLNDAEEKDLIYIVDIR